MGKSYVQATVPAQRFRHLGLSEKNKDRLLNMALLVSVGLFIGVFFRSANSQKPPIPLHAQYTTPQLHSLPQRQLPVYEEVQAVDNSAPNPTTTAKAAGSPPQVVRQPSQTLSPASALSSLTSPLSQAMPPPSAPNRSLLGGLTSLLGGL